MVSRIYPYKLLPPSEAITREDVAKQRYLLKPFDDLILCLRHEAAAISCFDNFLDEVISLIAELTGINPVLRRETNHVLYESFLWDLTYFLETTVRLSG